MSEPLIITPLDVYFPPRLLSKKINAKISTLKRWREKGIGPRYLKLNGHRILYRRADVLAWLERQIVETSDVAARSGAE